MYRWAVPFCEVRRQGLELPPTEGVGAKPTALLLTPNTRVERRRQLTLRAGGVAAWCTVAELGVNEPINPYRSVAIYSPGFVYFYPNHTNINTCWIIINGKPRYI